MYANLTKKDTEKAGSFLVSKYFRLKKSNNKTLIRAKFITQYQPYVCTGLNFIFKIIQFYSNEFPTTYSTSKCLAQNMKLHAPLRAAWDLFFCFAKYFTFYLSVSSASAYTYFFLKSFCIYPSNEGFIPHPFASISGEACPTHVGVFCVGG